MTSETWKQGFGLRMVTLRSVKLSTVTRGLEKDAVLLHEDETEALYVDRRGQFLTSDLSVDAPQLVPVPPARVNAVTSVLRVKFPWLAFNPAQAAPHPAPSIAKTNGMMNGRWYSSDDPGNPAFKDVSVPTGCGCGGFGRTESGELCSCGQLPWY